MDMILTSECGTTNEPIQYIKADNVNHFSICFRQTSYAETFQKSSFPGVRPFDKRQNESMRKKGLCSGTPIGRIPGW